MYPSSFNTADRPSVKPIEQLPSFGGAFPYGPRSLKIDIGGDAPLVQKRRKKRTVDVLSRNTRSAELGVTSAFEVVSEVDLDFVPNEEEERNRISIYQVITQIIRNKTLHKYLCFNPFLIDGNDTNFCKNISGSNAT